MLFSVLWAYQTSVNYVTRFTPFQLVYSLEATLPIECEIPSLKLAIELLPNTLPEEEHLLYLERLDETRRFATLVIEAHKKLVKVHFDQSLSPHSFVEGDLVLLYNQAHDKLGVGKFQPMLHGPYIIKCMFKMVPMSSLIMKVILLNNPEMGCISKNITCESFMHNLCT